MTAAVTMMPATVGHSIKSSSTGRPEHCPCFACAALTMASSPRACEFDDVLSRRAVDDCVETPRPCVKRLPRLIRIFVALVNSDDAGAAARNVIQDCLGHLQPHAEALQIRGNASANIMKGPMLRRHDSFRMFAARLRLFLHRFDDDPVD